MKFVRRCMACVLSLNSLNSRHLLEFFLCSLYIPYFQSNYASFQLEFIFKFSIFKAQTHFFKHFVEYVIGFFEFNSIRKQKLVIWFTNNKGKHIHTVECLKVYEQLHMESHKKINIDYLWSCMLPFIVMQKCITLPTNYYNQSSSPYTYHLDKTFCRMFQM